MTSLTEDIDNGLYERLERLRLERGVSFDQIANEAIRAGLDAWEARIPKSPMENRD